MQEFRAKPLEERINRSKEILNKFNNMVPVVIDKVKNSKMGNLKKIK